MTNYNSNYFINREKQCMCPDETFAVCLEQSLKIGIFPFEIYCITLSRLYTVHHKLHTKCGILNCDSTVKGYTISILV
jgi:hypothetical protein